MSFEACIPQDSTFSYWRKVRSIVPPAPGSEYWTFYLEDKDNEGCTRADIIHMSEVKRVYLRSKDEEESLSTLMPDALQGYKELVK